MQLTPRRRVVIAILVSWPVGYVFLVWAVPTLTDLFLYYRSGRPGCSGRFAGVFNSCVPGSFSPLLSWAELIVATTVVVLVAIMLARWTIRPFREMAELVDRFGPASIGLRVRAAGPADEARRLSDAIDGMLDRLAEGYEAQRRFASNVSHELRTPLATQRALIEVSLTSALTPDQLDLVARQLLATNERNERLIDGLLTLAETERGLVTTTPVALDRVAAEVVDTQRRTAGDLGVGVTIQLSPAVVTGEQPLLERLVANLVNNAIKYNHPGGVVEVSVQSPGTLVVTNTGPVVPADQVNGLFEPFRRMTGERLDHGGGVGLGLTIVRSIVAAHRGAVSASANPDGGLRVEARLAG